MNRQQTFIVWVRPYLEERNTPTNTLFAHTGFKVGSLPPADTPTSGITTQPAKEQWGIYATTTSIEDANGYLRELMEVYGASMTDIKLTEEVPLELCLKPNLRGL